MLIRMSCLTHVLEQFVIASLILNLIKPTLGRALPSRLVQPDESPLVVGQEVRPHLGKFVDVGSEDDLGAPV
jgi:hypothetical protein